ncbi:12775_t:CDS:2 [Entrophospora sp. SA101]|nr:12775_t:CDS:2 [Entrophospora sp. SA101]
MNRIWRTIDKNLARVLKPGGYLELCEYEIHVNSFIDIGKRFHNAKTVIATWETFQRIIQAKLKISDQNFKKSIDNFRLQSEDPNVKMFAKSHRVYAKKK